MIFQKEEQIFSLILSESFFLVFLEGPMGVGKTTFVRRFLDFLGEKVEVSSPTYLIAKTYKLTNRVIYHLDVDRIGHFGFLSEGLPQVFGERDLVFIEWGSHFLGEDWETFFFTKGLKHFCSLQIDIRMKGEGVREYVWESKTHVSQKSFDF